jgi:hypothetical protein
MPYHVDFRNRFQELASGGPSLSRGQGRRVQEPIWHENPSLPSPRAQMPGQHQRPITLATENAPGCSVRWL